MTVINRLRQLRKGQPHRDMFSSVTASTVTQLDHSPGHVYAVLEPDISQAVLDQCIDILFRDYGCEPRQHTITGTGFYRGHACLDESGLIHVMELGSGSAGSGNYLRGDRIWASVAAGIHAADHGSAGNDALSLSNIGGTLTDAQHGGRGTGQHGDSHLNTEGAHSWHTAHHGQSHGITAAEHTGFPGGTGSFLRADGAWAAPAGGGGGVVFREIILFLDDVGRTKTNVGSTYVELSDASHRTKFDLTGLSDARVLFTRTNNSATGTIFGKAQYSTDQNSWADLTPEGSSTGTAAQLLVGPFGTVPGSAKADVFLRAVVRSSVATDDPKFMMFRVGVK